jgi:hypothetical protein
MKTPQSIPFGRIPDLRSRPDAELIALKPGRGAFDDYRVKRYASRLALETFLRTPGTWYALVKTPVAPGMLIHPAFQKHVC